MKENLIPMKLQMFAEGSDGSNGQNQPNNPNQGQGQGAVQIDYNKIQQMLTGTLAAKEDVALKAYFKQQGLSQEEAEQAMTTFKQQKAASQPDVNALKSELEGYKQKALQSELDKLATLEVLGLGVEAKNAPYVIKLADMAKAVSEDGKINTEEIKKAVTKVLEDVPALKPDNSQSGGFVQIGTGTSGDNNSKAAESALRAVFGLN